jgi:hypothetical protein
MSTPKNRYQLAAILITFTAIFMGTIPHGADWNAPHVFHEN